MALHSRIKRINEELRAAIALIIMEEIKDPRLTHGMVTVSSVEVAKDLLASLPRDAAPQPFRPFPLGNAIASAIFLFLLASVRHRIDNVIDAKPDS